MLLCLVLSSRVLDGVGLGVFLEIRLGIAVHPKVGKQGLVSSGLGLADVRHLDRLLPQLPLVPVVVGVDVLLHKVCRGLDALIDHQLVLDSSLDCLVHEAELDLASRSTTFLKESSRRRK